MKCLCCGKELNNPSLEETTTQWHKTCVKKFFETSTLPVIDLSNQTIEQIAKESTNKGFTVPGVQKKLSLHLSTEDKKKPRLTLVNYPTGYILKPQTEEYKALPEAEYLVMSMAKETKIKTVPHALLKSSDTNEFVYITKRIDLIGEANKTQMLAMEDFCQLQNRLTIDKYKGSYERCAQVITDYSKDIGIDRAELFLRIVFSFVVGNSDMHLKNFSLIETDVASKIYHLSDAYDMLPVNVILPQDQVQFALTLNGKKKNIRYKDFMAFADKCELNKKAAEKMIEKVVLMKDVYTQMCQESYLPDDMKESLACLISQRVKILER